MTFITKRFLETNIFFTSFHTEDKKTDDPFEWLSHLEELDELRLDIGKTLTQSFDSVLDRVNSLESIAIFPAGIKLSEVSVLINEFHAESTDTVKAVFSFLSEYEATHLHEEEHSHQNIGRTHEQSTEHICNLRTEVFQFLEDFERKYLFLILIQKCSESSWLQPPKIPSIPKFFADLDKLYLNLQEYIETSFGEH